MPLLGLHHLICVFQKMRLFASFLGSDSKCVFLRLSKSFVCLYQSRRGFFDFSCVTVLKQTLEFRSPLNIRAGDETVGIDASEDPLRIALDEFVVEADLRGE